MNNLRQDDHREEEKISPIIHAHMQRYDVIN